jgi:hypothetical protein
MRTGLPSAHLTQEREKSKGFAANWATCGSCPVTIEMASRPQPFQDLSALFDRGPDGKPTANYKEHFGFDDGLGDPVFDGQYPNRYERRFMEGNGALDRKGN